MGTNGWVADTPGFSLGELQHPEPAEVAWQFPELAEYADECKFRNCLHLVEDGCKVLEQLEKIPAARYESYTVIVGESQAEQSLRASTSQKVDTGTVKMVGGKRGARIVPRLANRHRAASRKKEKQQLNDVDSNEDDIEGDDSADLWLNDDVESESESI
jgi:hypothetical protein